ncbi:MAG: HAD hydrolase-like protein [Halobacteriales archaeon]
MPSEYDAVVYDLDGTLVDLAVDWDAVRREVRSLFEGTDARADGDLWELLDRAAATGLDGRVEETIAAHEREGARASTRLPAADELAALDVPAAVCSLNAEDAARIALGTHSLSGHVEAVVGRDTGPARKPDPDQLLAAIEPLDAAPERSLFVGDSESDREAAERAGVPFRWA